VNGAVGAGYLTWANYFDSKHNCDQVSWGWDENCLT